MKQALGMCFWFVYGFFPVSTWAVGSKPPPLPPVEMISKPGYQLKVTCREFSKPIAVRACLNETIGSASPDVLFYFHGYEGTARAWATDAFGADAREGIRARWAATKVDAPKVIVISLTDHPTSWLLNETHDSYFSAPTFRVVADEVMPLVEKEFLGGALRGRRLLMGTSMGGFNALQILFKRSERFERAVITSPLIPLCPPYAGMISSLICAKSNKLANLKTDWVLGSLRLVRHFFPREKDWTAANPLKQAERFRAGMPRLLMTAGSRDEFGFNIGAKEYAEIARRQGAPVQWLAHGGTHFEYDAAALADFLIQK